MPPPLSEFEFDDLALDMTQDPIGLEMSQQELDMSGMERVPDADPGLDVSRRFSN
jgi:hypothetical protein